MFITVGFCSNAPTSPQLEPRDVAERVIDYLTHPEKLEEMRSRLRSVRGKLGAAQKWVQLFQELLSRNAEHLRYPNC